MYALHSSYVRITLILCTHCIPFYVHITLILWTHCTHFMYLLHSFLCTHYTNFYALITLILCSQYIHFMDHVAIYCLLMTVLLRMFAAVHFHHLFLVNILQAETTLP